MENTSATNPNKKKFVESLASKSYTGPSVVDYLSKSGYDSSLSSRNQLASEYGVKDYVPGSAQSNTALMAALRGGSQSTSGNVTNPSGTNVPGASDTTTSASGGTTTPSNPYKQYLQSLFGGDSYKSAFEKYGTDSERLAGIQNEGEAKELEARRLYEETLNRPGGLLGGAQQAAAVQSRLSNQELADLALRESAAARTAGASQSFLQTLLSAGKDLSDLTIEEQKLLQKETPEPFTISPGQGRYEYDETTGEYRQAAYLPPLPKATGAGTVTERQAQILGSYEQGFQAGETLPDGTPVIDQNGFITPPAWKVAISDAVRKGVDRDDFIRQYGNRLFLTKDSNPYQLTPSERSLIENTSRTSNQELDPALQALLDSIQ